jgi:WD40 repeat protein
VGLDGRAVLYDLNCGREVCQVVDLGEDSKGASLYAVDISKKGNLFSTASSTGVIRCWDPRCLSRHAFSLKGHTSIVKTLLSDDFGTLVRVFVCVWLCMWCVVEELWCV